MKYIYVCDTPLQILNCIKLRKSETLEPEAVHELYVMTHFRNADSIIRNVKEQKVFDNVCVFNDFGSGKGIKGKITAVLRLLFPKSVLRKYSADNAKLAIQKYDVVIMPLMTYLARTVLLAGKCRNFYLIEDGLGSYEGNILKMDFENNPIFKIINKVKYKGLLTNKPKRMYLNSIDFCKSEIDTELFALPGFSTEMLKCLEKVFDYKKHELYSKENNIVYLSQPYHELNGYIEGMEEAFMKEMESALSGDYIVRLHPRQAKEGWRAKLDSCNNSWELECIKQIEDKHTLFSLISTASFMPKLLCDKEPRVVFLYKLFIDAKVNPVLRKKAEQLSGRLKENYRDKSKVVVPNDMDELINLLKVIKTE